MHILWQAPQTVLYVPLATLKIWKVHLQHVEWLQAFWVWKFFWDQGHPFAVCVGLDHTQVWWVFWPLPSPSWEMHSSIKQSEATSVCLLHCLSNKLFLLARTTESSSFLFRNNRLWFLLSWDVCKYLGYTCVMMIKSRHFQDRLNPADLLLDRNDHLHFMFCWHVQQHNRFWRNLFVNY